MDIALKGEPEFVRQDFPDPKPTCTLCGETVAIVGLESEKRKGLWLCAACLDVVTKWCFMILARAVERTLKDAAGEREDEAATKH